MSEKIKPPFPYFGGKQRIASIIWKGLGEVISNYIEPFAGSLAVLLANPKIPKIETVNDINCMLANFWRSVSMDPEGVAKYADWPVNETELHARHRWLVSWATDDLSLKMNDDPDCYDVKAAGYWIYGIGASISGNWMLPKGLNALPMLSSAGGGIHGLTYDIREQFRRLQERLRRVRVACGQWQRVLTPSITYGNKGIGPKDITAVYLDPPYSFDNRTKVYKEKTDIYHDVCDWAVANGDNPRLRIALSGYENDYQFPDDWQKVNWNTGGGMSSLGDGGNGKENAKREVVYFSPRCLKVDI
jgi:site-specific DNA-adenine methylase